MPGFEHWFAGHESMSGAFMLLLWTAGVLTAGVIVIAVLAIRDFSVRETIDVLLRTAMALIIAVLGWTWLDYSILREHAAERRALDTRSAELTARAIAPGSALACLDVIGNETVAAACEQALFASPQAVAAAVAYVDARLVLLADGLEFAARDQSYTAALESTRRALEADRFGIVAHVLASRGCSAEDCAAFKLIPDTNRLRANLKERSFETYVVLHAASWPSDGTAAPVATAPAPAATPSPPAAGTPVASKYSFPSATSIPPISIMNAEPTGAVLPNSPSGPPTVMPAPERRPPAAPRRQSATRPPVQVAPLPLPPPPPQPAPPAAAQSPGFSPRP